ncbi:MAG: cupredoxin domain-containing protein, partial [Actinomycetota bacterium]
MPTPRELLRTDVYRVFVVSGVMLSLLISLVTAFRVGDAGPGGDSVANTFDVSLTELAITPKTMEATAGAPIVLNVSNDGNTAHNLAIEGGERTSMLAAGDSETLTMSSLDAGTYTLYCEVSGHREGGMEAKLTVGEGGDADHAEMDNEA